MNANLPTVNFCFSESNNLMDAGECRADWANRMVRHVAQQLKAAGAKHYRTTDMLVVLPGEAECLDMGLNMRMDISADHADMVDPIGADLQARATWLRDVLESPDSPYKRFVTPDMVDSTERYAAAWQA